MIPSSTVIAVVFAALCSTALPVALWIILVRKDIRLSRCVLGGMFGFFVPWIIILDPLFMLLGGASWYVELSKNALAFSLLLSLIAALVETAGRLVVLKTVLKNEKSFICSFSAGVGHGICEAMAYVGLMMVVNLIVCVSVLTNGAGGNASYAAIGESLSQTAASDYIATGIKTVLTLAVHIGVTVILAYFIGKNKILQGYLIAAGSHFLFYFIIKLTAEAGAWWSVAITALFAALFAAVTVLLRPKFPHEEKKIKR